MTRDSYKQIASLGGFGPLNGAALNPAATEIVTADEDGTARVIDARNGNLLGLLAPRAGGYAVSSAAFSPNGKLIVTTGEDGYTRIWDARTYRQSVPIRTSQVLSDAQFSPDSSRIVTAGSSGTAQIWDARTGKLIENLPGSPTPGQPRLLSASFSPDGTQVITAGLNGTAAIWDVATGRQTYALDVGTGDYTVWSASFSPNGKQILTASGDGVARIWDARLQTVVRSLGRAGTDTLTAASFGPGGKSVVTASAGGLVTVWGASGTEPVATLRSGAESNLLDSVALTPDGTMAVTGSHFGTATVWKAFRLASGKLAWKPLDVISIPGNDAINAVAFSPNTRQLATATQSGTVWLWDLPDGAPVGRVRVSDQPLRSVQFDPANPDWILASGDAGFAYVFNINTNAEVGSADEADTDSSLEDAVFSPNGKLIAVAGNGGDARIFVVGKQESQPDAFKPFGADLNNGDQTMR